MDETTPKEVFLLWLNELRSRSAELEQDYRNASLQLSKCSRGEVKPFETVRAFTQMGRLVNAVSKLETDINHHQDEGREKPRGEIPSGY